MPSKLAIATDRYVLIGAAVLLGGIFFLFRLTYGGATAEKKSFTHMHCPTCLQEWTYNRKLGSCPSCTPKTTMVPTIGSIEDGTVDAGFPFSKFFTVLILSMVLAQGFVYLIVVRRRVLQRRELSTESRVMVCRCPFCKRKLGYVAGRIGASATCPRCKTAFVLPAPGQEGFVYERDSRDGVDV